MAGVSHGSIGSQLTRFGRGRVACAAFGREPPRRFPGHARYELAAAWLLARAIDQRRSRRLARSVRAHRRRSFLGSEAWPLPSVTMHWFLPESSGWCCSGWRYGEVLRHLIEPGHCGGQRGGARLNQQLSGGVCCVTLDAQRFVSPPA